eukprot:1156586-Pelagomonas_calceolata.AAC.4
MTKPDLVHQHASWAITLQQYQFTIEHRPGVKHQNADTLFRFPHTSDAHCTEARLDPSTSVVALTVHLGVTSSLAVNLQLRALAELPSKAPFAKQHLPAESAFISDASDTALSEDAVHAFCSATPSADLPTCGGCNPCTPSSTLADACEQICLPKTLHLSLMTGAEEAKEAYKASGFSDVWLDDPVMENIRTATIAPGTPRHERGRIARRYRVYESKGNTLYRHMPDGNTSAVLAPENRAPTIKFVHEQHGHFGVRRTTLHHSCLLKTGG